MKFRVSFTAALLAAGLPLMSLQAAPLQAVPAVQAGNATQATMLAAGWAESGWLPWATTVSCCCPTTRAGSGARHARSHYPRH